MIELAVALVLVGLLSGLAVVSLRGTRGAVADRYLLEQLAEFDQRVRQRAWLDGAPREVVLDLGNRTVRERPVDGESTTPLRWSDRADSLQIDAVWTAEAGWVESGGVAWRCSGQGVSPTYALEVSRPGPSDGPRQIARYLVAGVTGQWTEPSTPGGRDAEIFQILRDPTGG